MTSDIDLGATKAKVARTDEIISSDSDSGEDLENQRKITWKMPSGIWMVQDV